MYLAACEDEHRPRPFFCLFELTVDVFRVFFLFSYFFYNVFLRLDCHGFSFGGVVGFKSGEVSQVEKRDNLVMKLF